MRVAGLISGTSMDGIDVAVADIAQDLDAWGAPLRLRPVAATCRPYPPQLRDSLVHALSPAPVGMAEVCWLDAALGKVFAQAAQWAVDQVGQVELVCSHGQTVYHLVRDGQVLGSLQLGAPAWIAERTGLPVVFDLRARDIAAGGQGAPLVSIVDALLLAGRAGVCAALNLGGIANLTVVGDGDPYAYDIGPANALLDAMVADATDGRLDCDRDGALATAGMVREDVLEALRDDAYYLRRPPKSTGKEYFNLGYLRRVTARRRPMGLQDAAATLTELTARTVADAVADSAATWVLASGGGTRNPRLMERVTRRLPEGTGLEPIDALGIPSDAKEAYAFAVLGYLTWHGIAGTLPSCTGARHASVLGSITPGRDALRLPDPARLCPTRLLIEPAAG